MGHLHVKTPNLDQLAKQSVVFEHGPVPTALCRATQSPKLTGRVGTPAFSLSLILSWYWELK